MQYDEEFKKNAVKLSYASPKTVKQVADDLGIKENRLYIALPLDIDVITAMLKPSNQVT